MPQMSPLLWGILFISFSFLMFLTSVKVYYLYFKHNPSPPSMATLNQVNPIWKW